MRFTCDFSLTSLNAQRTRAMVPWDISWHAPISGAPAAMIMDFVSDSFGRNGLRETQSALITTDRPGPASYFNAQGTMAFAGNNVARIDHDPNGAMPLGLLTERANSNLVVSSDLPANQTVPVTAVPHCFSFYGNGTVALSGSATQTITGTGGVSERTTLTFTPTAGPLSIAFSGDVIAPQLEVRSRASSYIATGPTGGLRAADDVSSDLGGWFSGQEGTLVFSGSLRSVSANERVLEIDNGSSSSRISILWNTVLNKPQLQVWNAGALQAAIVPSGSDVMIDQNFRVAVAFAPNNFAISLDGGAVTTDVSGTMPTGLSKLRIGRALGGGQCNLVTESIVYYHQRLSDAELEALSA